VTVQIGAMFLREWVPERIPAYARMLEAAGFDDLWIIEDAFFNGGISGAAVALGATERLHVGIGVQPAVVRNAAYNAMDLATLARCFPGRLEIGLGHGVAEWVHQVGAFPSAQVQALEQHTQVLRALLAGETVSIESPDLHLEAVALEYPPSTIPRVSLGVTGPKSMQMSGRVADGTIMVELTGPALVRSNLNLIRTGQLAAGRAGTLHQVTVFAYWRLDDDREAARAAVRPMLAARLIASDMRELGAAGLAEDARQLLAQVGAEDFATVVPDRWIDEMAVVGDVNDCREVIARLEQSGVQRVGLVPPIEASFETISSWAGALLANRF